MCKAENLLCPRTGICVEFNGNNSRWKVQLQTKEMKMFKAENLVVLRQAKRWRVVAAAAINVRAEKASSSGILATKDPGTVVQGDEDDGWLKLQGEPGFITLRSLKTGKALLQEITDEAEVFMEEDNQESEDEEGESDVADLEKWKLCQSWLEKSGAMTEAIEVKSSAGALGLGAYARRPLKAGDVAFTVPQVTMMTPEAAARGDVLVSALSKLLQPAKDDPADLPSLLLTLRLCRARSRPEDEYHAYAASLPEAPGCGSWNEDFLRALRPTSLGPALAAAAAQLDRWLAALASVEASLESEIGQELKQNLKSDVLCRESLDWGRAMVRSRHFPGAFAGDTDAQPGCMVPLLDILNHKDGAPIHVQIRENRLEFVLEADVEQGAQIWNDYGSKAHDELLLCYGFATDDNPEDHLALSILPPPAPAMKLTRNGIPAELVEFIEGVHDAGDTETADKRFESLLQALHTRRTDVKQGFERANKRAKVRGRIGALTRARWRFIATFLRGQNEVLEACLKELASASQ